MKQKRLFILGLVLAFAGITQAADILKVQDVEVAAGESVTLNIELTNTTTNLMGWQCDISLPEGLTLELKANGKPKGTLGERFKDTDHSISSSKLANGDYRFIVTSMDGDVIPGTSGTMFSVTVIADASLAAGTKMTGTVKNIEFNTKDNQKLTFSDVSFAVTISGETTPGGDDPQETSDVLKVEDVEVASGESAALNIELTNTTTNLMGWQCDISLPEGLTLELKANGKPKATLGERFETTEHTISSTVLANGSYRFIATSMDGETIPGTSGTLFTVTLKADVSLAAGTKLSGVVKNIEFNTKDNQKLTFSDVSINVSIKSAAILGDVNGDGEVNVGDIVTVCNVMAGISTVDPQVADVNKDGEVNVGDIVTICNIMAGKE